MDKQEKQVQWKEQWTEFADNELFLFQDWIHPNTLSDFEGKDVLECGCGGGQHTSFIAPHSKSVLAVDLNATEVAIERNRDAKNVQFIEEDIATMALNRQFDIVFSIGVIHHTDEPDSTVENMKTHLLPGGRMIVWVYSLEGNWIAKNIVERFRARFLAHSSTATLKMISRVLTIGLYVPVYTIYQLPLTVLPYYSYFKNFRKLSFERNLLNVFDKLNAPQVDFIDKNRVKHWFSDEQFSDVYVDHYRGVSWRASGTLK